MIPLPLKQGLKHQIILDKFETAGCYDSTSTKTRIETQPELISSFTALDVMIPLPLKQGLKPLVRVKTKSGIIVMIPLPLKQGLKHVDTHNYKCKCEKL